MRRQEDKKTGRQEAQALLSSSSSGTKPVSQADSPPSSSRLAPLLALLKMLLALLSGMSNNSSGARKGRKLRPWHLRVGRKDAAARLEQSDVDRLLQQHRDLKDVDKLAALASGFRLPESDFFADPRAVERLMRRLLEENAPWLRVGATLAGSGAGSGTAGQEVLYRELETRVTQDVTLFVPEESWRDAPLASRTQRPARTLNEVWSARLLDQILPPEVQIDRFSRGEILIPVRSRIRQRLEFRAEPRRIEIVTRRTVPVSIEIEADKGNGRGGQLLYILLDYSASMAGKSAVLALAVIAATVRANLGQQNTRYLFRRYADAEALWPRMVEPPLSAQTVAEKDALLDAIFATNFRGGATHVNDALEVAASDIENLRRDENLDPSLLLVTDGRAEMLESTRLRLLRAGVKVHTVMVTPEPNPSLEALSESFTALNIGPDTPTDAAAPPVVATPLPQPRRAFHI